MRTTAEVIEAARMGEPCTEEELHLCIVSMRTWILLVRSDIVKWCGDNITLRHVKLKANCHWKHINNGFNIPLDERVGSDRWPGNPDLYRRREITNKVVAMAGKSAAEKRVDPKPVTE